MNRAVNEKSQAQQALRFILSREETSTQELRAFMRGIIPASQAVSRGRKAVARTRRNHGYKGKKYAHYFTANKYAEVGVTEISAAVAVSLYKRKLIRRIRPAVYGPPLPKLMVLPA